jgi:RND family efflux transporter MFP subunit
MTPAKGNGNIDAIAESMEHDHVRHSEGHDDCSSHVPVHFGRGTPRGALLFALVVAIALVAVFVIGWRTRAHAELSLSAEVAQEASQPVPVDVVHVDRAPAASVLSLPGRASAWYETTLYGRVSGYVEDFYKDIGAHVKAGEKLAEIETPELNDQYAAAMAKLHELEAERKVAETAVSFANVSFNRWNAAVPDGVVAVQERDQKESELAEAQAKLNAAIAQIASGQAEVNRLNTLLGFKQVTAPFDGVITRREVDKGTLVTAGSTTNTTPLFAISQYDQVRVFVDVPEGAVPDIHNGMNVAVQGREFPGRTFMGKVARTSEAIDPVSKTLNVEVDVPNPKLLLLPGMFVMSTFQTSRTNPPLRVPAAALTFGPSGAEVAVVGADSRIQFKPITIGRDLGNDVEIASGLNGNETIALNVGSQVVDGEQVNPHLVDDVNTVPASSPASPSMPGPKPTVTADASGEHGHP